MHEHHVLLGRGPFPTDHSPVNEVPYVPRQFGVAQTPQGQTVVFFATTPSTIESLQYNIIELGL